MKRQSKTEKYMECPFMYSTNKYINE